MPDARVILRGEAQALRVAIGVGIGIRARDHRVAVGILADDEAGRLLVEVRSRERELPLPAALRMRPYRVELFLLEPGRVAPAAVVGAVHDDAEAVAVGSARGRDLQLAVLVAATFHDGAEDRDVLRHRRDHVDDAVHGARAIKHASGPAQDLDRGRLLEIHLEELVDVAASDRADRDSVLEHEHRAAGARAGQHRRAQRSERLLPAAALDHRARRAIDELRRMGGADERDGPGLDARCAAGISRKRDRTSRRGHDHFLERRGSAGHREEDRRQRELPAHCGSRIHSSHYRTPQAAASRARATITSTR